MLTRPSLLLLYAFASGMLLVGCLGETSSVTENRNRTAASTNNVVHEDWPQIRGPRRDGISKETGLLLDWSERQPEVVWEQPLGAGFSEVAVLGDQLYTMAAVGEEEFAFCLNAATGSVLWKVQTGELYSDPQGGDGPRATPVVDGDRVYVLGAHGDLLCLGTQAGEIIWQRNILEDFGVENLQWGVSTTPLIDGEKLVVNVGAKGASIVAFDKSNGDVIWKALDDVAGYSSPIKIMVAGDKGESVPEYVVFCGRSLVGVSPEDGQEHWRQEWITTSDMNIATPIYDPATQLLFVSAARDTGRCSAYRLTARDGTVHCEHIYTNKEMRNHFSSCVLVDGYIYGYDNSLLKCIELASGKQMWENRSVGKGSLISVDGHLLVLGEGGALALVEATPEEYREQGRVQALDSTRAWTAPSLSRGRLYVRDLNHIACLDLSAEQ